MARYRSYHGATAGAISLTGDPRRWADEPGMPGVVRVLDPCRWHQRGETEPVERTSPNLEEVIQYEGPNTIAAFIMETVTGTNGILIPPDGYLQGVRELCDRHGILMICDEVMAGFGRTGRWFAVDHWGVVPDLMTMAKGLTSSYLQLGAVAMSREIADCFSEKVYFGGLTYTSHPISCAAAIAAIRCCADEDMVGTRGAHGRPGLKEPLTSSWQRSTRASARCAASACSGSSSWFATARHHGADGPVQRLLAGDGRARQASFRDDGLYTMPHWNHFFTNPPLLHHRGAAGARASRSSIAPSRSPMPRSPEHRDGGHAAAPAGDSPVALAIGFFVVFVVGILVLWELIKFIGGDPWRYCGMTWRPPLEIWFATRHQPAACVGRSWRASAAPDLRIGRVARQLPRVPGALHLARGVHRLRARRRPRYCDRHRPSSISRLVERAFLPYVVASQTIPIVALAPMIVFFVGHNMTARRDHRHLPELLPGHDRHAPRTPFSRPAGAGADALLRRNPTGDPLQAAIPRLRCRTCSRR